MEIDTVPLRPEDFPLQIVRILERVADQTEVHEPTLFYFAQELWIQFVMAVYGTRDYDSMLEDNDSMTDIWAAALHMTVADSLGGSHDEEDTRSMYAVTGAMRFRLEQAYRSMKQFVSAGLGANKGRKRLPQTASRDSLEKECNLVYTKMVILYVIAYVNM